MRACQICGSQNKIAVMDDYAGTTNPPLTLFECGRCGHRYLDGNVDQAWFDNYYLTKYKTDDKPYSDARLNSLADCVARYITKPINNVSDIGGTDMELVNRLRARGIMAWAYGVRDEKNEQWNPDAVILSHTLEHIYDVSAMMERVKSHLQRGGYLFIEVPIHIIEVPKHLYDDYLPPTDYDYHWQHINKFRLMDLIQLLHKDFEIVESTQLPDYREYKTWRIVGEYAVG